MDTFSFPRSIFQINELFHHLHFVLSNHNDDDNEEEEKGRSFDHFILLKIKMTKEKQNRFFQLDWSFVQNGQK